MRQTAAMLLVACAGACARADHAAADEAAVQREAVRLLFREREQNRTIVLWADAMPAGPVLETLGEPTAAPRPGGAATLGGVSIVRRADLDTLFRAHPDGWAAFFAQHAGATGVIELARPRYASDLRTATLVVGRACGEHCRQAWRVRLRRVDGGRWQAIDVAFVRVPQS